MLDLLLITAFICSMALMQYKQTKVITLYNDNLTEGLLPKKQKNTWFNIAMLVMVLLIAFRAASIGNDTEEYRNIFYLVNSDENYLYSSRYEKGFLYLNKLVGLFTDNPQVLFVILAIFQFSVFGWFVQKYSEDVAFSLVLVFLMLFGTSMNILRQMTATAFIFIGVDRVLNKKTIRAYIWLIIAILFHTTSAVFLIIPILPYVKFNNLLAIILFLLVTVITATNALYFICLKVLPEYAHYFTSSYAGTGQLATFYQILRNGLFFAVGYYGINKFSKDDSLFNNARLSSKRQINMALWCMYFTFVAMLFAFRVNLMDRIVSYAVCFYIVLLPNSIKKLNLGTQQMVKTIILLLLISYSILVQAIRPEWNTIYPYLFFWQS